MSAEVAQIIDEEPIDEAQENVSPKSAPSIRESLAAALEQSKANQNNEERTAQRVSKKPLEQQTGRERDETGKFSPKTVDTKSKVADKTAKQPSDGPIQADSEVKAPANLSAGFKAEWNKLPVPIQKEIAKREEEFHRELTKHDEERVFGRAVKSLADPYMPLIKAENGDVTKAFASYLNTAYILRTKSPQEKGRVLLQLAQEFGADLRGASQPQANVDPRFNQVLQELQHVKSTLQQEQEAKKQQEEMALKSQIDAFAADPAHQHFEAVKADMAALLKGGIVQNLQDAYDRAIYANPQTRSTLLTQQNAESEEKRLAEKKARAEQARRAGSSVKGAPGMAALKNGKIVQPNLRAEIAAAFASHRDG